MVEVQQGTLRSAAHCSGPAGNAATTNFHLRSGGGSLKEEEERGGVELT